MVKIGCKDEERDIGINDAAVVFRADGTLDILIPKIDENDTETDVGSNVLVATVVGGLLCRNDQIKEMVMNEIEAMCKFNEQGEDLTEATEDCDNC